MNSPVILITNKEIFNIKKEYERYYRNYLNIKLFSDVKDAANHVNLNLHRIEKVVRKSRQQAISFFVKICVNMKIIRIN